MQKSDNPVIQGIYNKLAILESQKKLEPINAILSNGTRLAMERIDCTTHYLSSLRKVIYDVTFENLYCHNCKVPENCIAVGDFILRIEESAHIEQTDAFLAILNKPRGKCRGTKFYLDDVLYLDNVNFLRSDSIRDNILLQRQQGTMVFDVLKILDPSGNTTEFLASKAVQKRMAEAKEAIRANMMINQDAVLDYVAEKVIKKG
jgi:hypothetical protein